MDNVEKLLVSIGENVNEILRLLISSNQITTSMEIRDLADEIAMGNKAALHAHNKAQKEKFKLRRRGNKKWQ